MNENMRKVYEEEINPEITNVEEINEDEIQIIQYLKEEGISYKKEICKKEIKENFYALEESSDTFFVISVPEEYVKKILEDLPDEFHDIEFRTSNLSDEELKELNKICADDYESAVANTKTISEYLMENDDTNKKIKKMYNKWNFYSFMCLMCFAVSAVIVLFKDVIDEGELLEILRVEITLNTLTMVAMIPMIIAFVCVVLIVLFTYKSVQAKKYISNKSKELKEELIPIVVTNMPKPLVYQVNGSQYFNEREIEIIKEMYNREEFEIGNKISMNDGGECFTVTELITEMYPGSSSAEPYKIRQNIIKTKSKRHIEEPILINIFYDEEKSERKLIFETYKNSCEVSNEVISIEFGNKAKELYQKYGRDVSLYYIADVVYIIIDFDFDFSIEKFFNQKEIDIQTEIEEHYTGMLEVIRNYIELAEIL